MMQKKRARDDMLFDVLFKVVYCGLFGDAWQISGIDGQTTGFVLPLQRRSSTGERLYQTIAACNLLNLLRIGKTECALSSDPSGSPGDRW